MGDQSTFVASSFDWIKSAVDSGTLSIASLEESRRRIIGLRSTHKSTSAVNAAVDFNDLIKGFEISGLVELGQGAVNLVEIGTKPTIAAGDVSWGMHRELRAVGIACDIHELANPYQ